MGLVAGAIYTALLLVAAVGDVRTRRIPNGLVAVLAVLGLAVSVLSAPIVAGASRGLGGLLTGFACWLPFYALGWLGAGDVKLFAAAGSWLGPLYAVEAALIAAVSGAVLALIWMLRSRGAKDVVSTLVLAAARPTILASGAIPVASRKTLPYGVALVFGALVSAWMPGLLL